MKHDIFVAHVEEDYDIALEIALGLEQAGHSTWTYEADSIPGPSYLVQTGQAVEDAQAIIVIISPPSVSSRQVTKEIVRAHEAGKDFIPVRRDISHIEFQNRQPEWREAIGAAASIEITADGLEDVIQRILDGIKFLGIKPQPEINHAHIKKIRRALDELKRQITPEEVAKPEESAEQPEEPVEQPEEPVKPPEELPKPPEEPAEPPEEPTEPPEEEPIATPVSTPEIPRKRRKYIGTAAIAAAAVVIIVIVVVFLSGLFAKHSLDIVISPAGGGTVSPASGDYDADSQVTLTATPAEGYAFDRWSGDVTGTSATITLTVDEEKIIVAYFKQQYTLGITVSPVGGGTVSPAGGDYDADSQVTLTATPAEGYIFDRWSGDVTGQSTSVTLTMDGGKSIVAYFQKQYTLGITVSPAGGGTVSPAGGDYDADSQVTLTATPTKGYIFDRWSGDVTGQSTSVTLTMDSGKNIVAYFQKQYTLGISVSPAGGGTVSPASGDYDADSQVTLRATPAEGYIFDRWGGDVSGESTSVKLTMNSTKSVVAYFNRLLLEDHFNDNRNDWYINEYNYITNGTYNMVIQREDPTITVTRRNWVWPPDSPGVANFGFEADVITINCEDDNGRGIVFLWDPRKSDSPRPKRRFIFITSGYGNYKFYHDYEGDHTVIIDWTKSSYINTGRATNRLKVICRNGAIELYANDHLLETIKGEFPEIVGDNGIGLLTSGEDGTHMAFDNVRMWEISDAP